MINYGYSPTFPAPVPHYFRLPQTHSPVPSPYFLVPPRNPAATYPALQQSTQQSQQPQSAATSSTTTTTTTTTSNNSKSHENPFPDNVTSIQPVTPEDGQIPNKTFEVLREVKPTPAFPLHIPTTVIALNTRLNQVFKYQILNPSSDSVKAETAQKLSAVFQGSDELSRDDNAMRFVSERQGLLVNEIRVYSDPPIVRWLFLVAGIVLIVLGILAVLWCRPSDQFYYCRIWAGIALVIFAIIGYIHGGDYITNWKNFAFIIFGLVTSVMTLACLYFVMKILCHRVIEIFQFNTWSGYLDEVRWRMAYLNDYPRRNLSTSDQPFPSDNEVACLAIDGSSFLVDCASFVIVVSTTLVTDKFYNSLHVVTLKVHPFDKPRLFNPYGQVLVGEVQIFFGFLLNCVVYGNQNVTWQSILAPAFSGILPIIAGIVASLTLKSCGINSQIWNFLAIILEILSLVATVVAIILLTVGLAENVKTFSSIVMTQTTFSQNLMIFSVFAFSAADLICLISLCYTVAVLIRLVICICCPERHSKELDGKTNENYDWNKQDVKYREVKKMLLQFSTK